MNIRKTIIHHEIVYSESGAAAAEPITRMAGLVVVKNPFAGKHVTDLSELFDIGARLGEQLMDDLVARLGRAAVSYGKAALVGVHGDFEHGGACIHPKLGKPMRAAIGGGKALIPSNVKVAAPGASIDVPLGHKDEPFSFDHFDTLTLSVADGPRSDEIVIIMAVADGGRVNARCGAGPIAT